MTDESRSGVLGASAPSQRRAMAAATITSVIAVMPVFLLGATAVLVRADLGFSPAALGATVTAYFVTASVLATLAGRLVERLGPGVSMRLICLGSGASLLAIAVLADGLADLVALMVVAGAVNGMSQPAANLTLARAVRRRPGLMFGIKQSGVPLSTLIAGASVPLLALTVGWRWTFAATALLAGLALLVIPAGLGPRNQTQPQRTGRPVLEADARARLVWLSVATGLGTAGATAMASFLVEAAVVSGVTVAAASGLLVAGSVAGVMARLAAGHLADRSHVPPLRLVAAMLSIGAIGYGLLSVGDPSLMLPGALLGYAFGFGWTGLVMFAVVRLHADAPAAATGVILTGAAGGAAVGPLGFGLIATHSTTQVAWWACAAAAVLSSTVIVLVRRGLLPGTTDGLRA